MKKIKVNPEAIRGIIAIIEMRALGVIATREELAKVGCREKLFGAMNIDEQVESLRGLLAECIDDNREQRAEMQRSMTAATPEDERKRLIERQHQSDSEIRIVSDAVAFFEANQAHCRQGR